ncbi:hypothetical protein A5320_02125 [Rheinheimera sp. SA_1]|uniref:hypothetical protein n=1 Tax=Rheinheimera sp. SA_1 TaxID=1827365 RepID=UPI0008021185|nr:hypothetical protein [Rheinheimera sp. SA_1]OBP16234.1 hypothetical protein A5320_02125 [Rheinheimera sp. SA_1]
MEVFYRILTGLFGLFLLLTCNIAFGQEDSRILYHYTGQILRDSKWGKIALFQESLSMQLVKCGKKPIAIDGIFGNDSLNALAALKSCDDFKNYVIASSHPISGEVHTNLWQKLLPETPLPTVHERAFALSLSHEGTDYDQVQWNYNTSDDKSALTWGPYGATVGYGQEVQAILRKINSDDPALLENVFENEFETIQELIKNGSNGYELLKKVFLDGNRRKIWVDKFRILSTYTIVRENYEAYALSDKWLRSPMKLLYRLLPNGMSNGTEIDYSFFLDNSMHMTINMDRVRKCLLAIEQEQKKIGRNLTPAERRRVISKNLVPSMQQNDRLGRNVVYYVDEIGDLSQNEMTNWKKRTNRKASNFGLSDARKYNPSM